MKIFAINDCEWWMAGTLEEALAGYAEMMGKTLPELREDYDVCEAHEIAPEDYDRLHFVDEGFDKGDENSELRRTFREEMNRREQRSQYFATTEI